MVVLVSCIGWMVVVNGWLCMLVGCVFWLVVYVGWLCMLVCWMVVLVNGCVQWLNRVASVN